MQNLYPLFERNRILKKELLWSLRDYAFGHLRLEYKEYADGILQGCDVRVEDNQIVVSPGIIKLGDFILLMSEEESIGYEPSDEFAAVKMRFDAEQISLDYVLHKMELVSDKHMDLKENEFEVCRYKLQEGAILRDQHTDLWDMATEYNTLNYIYATWGGLGGQSIAPAVSRRFAREILKSDSPQPHDVSFAYLCLGQPGAVPMEILRDYLTRRGQERESRMTNEDIFRQMCKVIKNIRITTESRQQEQTGRKKIIVY